MVTGPQRAQNFALKECLIFFWDLWAPVTIYNGLVDQIDTTSFVCDPKWVSYALEQAERLISHTRLPGTHCICGWRGFGD